MATLNKDIFGLTVENHELVKLAYDAYLANSRSSHAKTLKRGEVRGGVRSHGSKKVLVGRVLVPPVTQSGVMVVWHLVAPVKKISPRRWQNLRSA